ncbi:MAG: DUF3854 domain-containing protein [Gemmataceae bacterium]
MSSYRTPSDAQPDSPPPDGGNGLTSRNGRHLLPHHQDALLRRYGLAPGQIDRCGFYSETDPRAIEHLLRWKGGADQLGAALIIPFCDVNGRPLAYCQVRPDRPLPGKGDKPRKYESPKGQKPRLYVPPGTRAALTDPAISLLITEGPFKAAAADQHGFPCVALTGVTCWQQAREKGADGKATGQRVMIPDLAAVTWTGRRVYIVFDSDATDNVNVQWAEWHMARALSAAGADVRVVRLPATADRAKQGLDDYLLAEGPDALRRLLEQADRPTRPTPTLSAVSRTVERPVIVLGVDELRVNDEAVAALARSDLYQRADSLIRVVEMPAEDRGQIARPAGHRMFPVEPATLREVLTGVASFRRLTDTKGGTVAVPAAPTPQCVSAVHHRRYWPGVRRLTGVVSYPVVRPDGTVLTARGYDPGTGLFLSGDVAVAIPPRPTRADAATAAADLLEVVCDFPFEAAAHRSAWIAGLLTPLARFAFRGPAPLFLVDGNGPGVGKGKLVMATATIVFGRGLAVTTYAHDAAECRKLLTTIAAHGDPAVLFDNVAGPFGCGPLDAALTADEWSDRVLGETRQVTFPLLTVFYATANNCYLCGDLGRRVCPSRLVSPHERPEERAGFRHPDLEGWTAANRPRLLSAALTVLSAYLRAGRPDVGVGPLGSFEGWCGAVRNAIIWADQPDPMAARGQVAREADDRLSPLAVLLAGWERLDPPPDGLTARGVVDRAFRPSVGDDLTDIQEAIRTLCGAKPGQGLEATKLGYRFREFRDRPVGGRMLSRGEPDRGSYRWSVTVVGAGQSAIGGHEDMGDMFPALHAGGERGEEVVGNISPISSCPQRPTGRLFSTFADQQLPD